MKRTLAMLMVVLMMLALTAAAYAETRGYMEWDEELQMYVIRVFEVDDGPALNPNPPYEDYEQLNIPASVLQSIIDWRDY